MIIGTSLGWPSPVLMKIRETHKPIDLSSAEKSWMVSLLYAGNFVSPIPAGCLMDKFGRKKTALILSILSIISWILAVFPVNAEMLYVSRFLSGLWSGIASTIIPMYLGEISEPNIRGALSTLIQIMANVGVVYEYVIGPYVSYTVLGILSALIPVLFFISFLFMPESPYWYMMDDRREDAGKSLCWLRAAKENTEIESELSTIEASVKEQMKNKQSFKDLLATKGNRKGMLIVQMLAIFQRASGVSGVMAYTSITLPRDGYNPDTCVLIMGVIWIVSVFLSTALVDVLGRRPLLGVSAAGSGIAMGLNAIWYYFRYKSTVIPKIDGTYWIPVLGLFMYGFFFSIGLGPVASTVQSEYFPSNTKRTASAITAISLAVTSFIMNKIYLIVEDVIGMYFNFVIFTAASFLCLIFVITYVIETKGKTLQEIQDELDS